MPKVRPSLLPLAVLLSLTGTALLAHPGGLGWGGPGWDGPGWPDRPGMSGSARAEGKVEVTSFVADGATAAALGMGRIAVIEAPAGSGVADAHELATYEAAVIDALARSGYDTASADPAGGQIAEMRVLHTEAQAAEAPHKPVSGEMMMGVSNRGSMLGMAINVDMTKPRGALIATRLEARIRDRASGAVLWEGNARILTRAGDARWTGGKIAGRLAAALFEHFPAARQPR